MIQLMKNTFFNEEDTKKKLSNFILDSKRLSMGEKCLEFENNFANYQNRKYSVFVNSGSSANLALIQALLNMGKIKKGDNVGFSAVTWATNVMPIIQLGLNPVPVDISLESLNVELNDLNSLKTNIKVLFLTNLLGFSGQIEKIADYCQKKGILLLEDNCESLGSVVAGKKLGNFGIASTFSFFVGHHLSTIEGGMICTDDRELYNNLLMVRAHGWLRNVDEDKKNELRKKFKFDEFYDRYTFYCLAYNLRPTEINGFLGIEQLKYIDEILKKRNENFQKFFKAANSNPDFIPLNLDHMEFISNFAFPVICKDNETLKKYLNIFKDVEIRPIVGGSIIEQPFFRGDSKTFCPNAKKLHELGFYLPNNPDLTSQEIEYITKLLLKK